VPLTPTDEENRLTETLCKRKVPYAQITSQIMHGISINTLRRQFKPELQSAKVSRKPFDPTDSERKIVTTLAANELRYRDTAAMVRDGISILTLTKHLKPKLQRGIKVFSRNSRPLATSLNEVTLFKAA